jgi:hypothetical protein
MQSYEPETSIIRGVNVKVFRLQRRLLADSTLRAQFNADWKAKRADGLTMIEAIKQTRDEWLTRETRK